MASNENFLPPFIVDYITSHAAPEHPVLGELRRETAKLGGISVMQIAREQGPFVALLIEIIGARRYLEIGTFTGYSALAATLAMGPEGYSLCCDVSEEWTAIARRYWQKAGVAAQIDLRLGDARATLRQLIEEGLAGSFDLMFIDADKPGYSVYFEHGLTLLRPGGLILVDNVLWSGRVADPSNGEESTKAIRAFNDALASDPRVAQMIVPIGDGVTMARKR
jgi:predicted O-methyltransferase YrrM